MGSGNGALAWWANRKSRMGLRNLVASAPPKLPDGRDWWCAPPTAPPEPAHLEYVLMFQRQLLTMKGSRAQNAMQKHVADWIAEARRLYHERVTYDTQQRGLLTTDDLLRECKGVISHLANRLSDFGIDAWNEPRVRRALDELTCREAQILSKRARDPDHPIRRRSET